ncbi:hypothetical protein QQF64_008125 [Cirrhinus molitorella]|uniref:Uncharacterized protein n=1 Tax=Cirrhinus molitorella TaxID=172907 RepID=A0ABR3M9A1_9TELE
MTRYCSLFRRLLSHGSKGEDEDEEEGPAKTISTEPVNSSGSTITHAPITGEPVRCVTGRLVGVRCFWWVLLPPRVSNHPHCCRHQSKHLK